MEKYLELGRCIFHLFIDFKQAFDLIWREGLWHNLLHFGIPQNLASLIRDMHSKLRSRVTTGGSLSECIEISTDVLQGCLLSPELFNLFLTAVLSLLDNFSGVLIRETLIDKLAYADDIDQINENLGNLQSQADNIQSTTKHFGMTINSSKTKAMLCSRKPGKQKS